MLIYIKLIAKQVLTNDIYDLGHLTPDEIIITSALFFKEEASSLYPFKCLALSN